VLFAILLKQMYIITMDFKKLKGIDMYIALLEKQLKVMHDDFDYEFHYDEPEKRQTWQIELQLAEARADLKKFFAAIEKYDYLTKLLLHDKYIKNLSAKEICQNHGISRSALYSRIKPVINANEDK